MMNRTFLSLTASLLAACDPGDGPDPDPVDAAPPCDLWYADVDGDHHGDAHDVGVRSCPPIPGRVRVADDCDDHSRHVHPDQHELCDGVDNDCDGHVEPAAICPAGCTVGHRTEPATVYLVCGPLSWTQSRDRCRAHGMDLVHVDDATENAFVFAQAHVAYPSEPFAWLGATDEGHEGAWHWADTDRVFWTNGVLEPGAYANWRSAQPDNFGSENCGHMYLQLPDAQKWNDLPCGRTLVSVCERPRGQ